LVAEWTQEAEGEIHLFPSLAKAFPNGRMSTMTPQAFEAAWPKVGERVGMFPHRSQTGYWLVNSSLNRRGDGPVVYYDGILDVFWRYRQRRRETVLLTLSTGEEGRVKGIRWFIRHAKERICPTEASFFQTKEGERCVQSALDRARVHVSYSRRCREVTVEVPLAVAWAITIRDEVTVSLPGMGRVTGKVISLRFVQTWEKGLARFVLAVGGEMLPPIPMPSYECGKFDNPVVDGPWIDQIKVLHDGLSQEKERASGAKQIHPTTLHINLKDLRTSDVKERIVRVPEIRI
jgi:hypothetical protein